MVDVPLRPDPVLERRVRQQRIVVVDDHRLLGQMLADRLNERGHETLIADVSDRRLASVLMQMNPDLVVLDAVFHDDEDGGLRILRELRAMNGPDVLILTGVTDEVRHAVFLAEGASAVISKADSFEGVVSRIEDVIAGIDPMGAARRASLAQLLDAAQTSTPDDTMLSALSERELATLQALVDGRTVDEIALVRTVATSTVRSHVRAVLRKLEAHSQIEAVSIAARAGLRPQV